jgi:hypothetical protein
VAACLLSLIKGPDEPRFGHAVEKKIRKRRDKRDRPPLALQACRSSPDPDSFGATTRLGRTLRYAWNLLLAVKRNNMPVYSLRTAQPAPVVVSPRRPEISGGVTLPKLPKLLNQEDA